MIGSEKFENSFIKLKNIRVDEMSGKMGSIIDGIYCVELCRGIFKDNIIVFSILFSTLLNKQIIVIIRFVSGNRR